ncbi:MAG: prepilin-type N-terminal cleavage/methylation domain-containing protein [Calditrichaeota bacterium]|nr:MAG: prepilin-type N-terminal cleavage/methylation domain-containing protein [Calditrichota bacterium]
MNHKTTNRTKNRMVTHDKKTGAFARDERGFTLVEMLAALTIFSLIGVAALVLLKNAVAARDATNEAAARLQRLHRAQSLLLSDLQQAATTRLGSFVGGSDSLSFTINHRDGDTGGPARVRYWCEVDRVNGLKSLFRTRQTLSGETTEQRVLEHIQAIAFGYLFKNKKRFEWVDTWPDNKGLPTAVRATMALAQTGETVEILQPILVGTKIPVTKP